MRFRQVYWSALFVTVAGLAAIAGGWIESDGLQPDRAGAGTAFIAGIIAAIFGSIAWRSAAKIGRNVARLRAENGLQGRWFIRPEGVAEFLDYEKSRSVLNEWRPSRNERRHGVEVVWGGEHLVVGGTYWRIAAIAYPAIQAVGFDPGPPLTVVVRYRQKWFNPLSSLPKSIDTERDFRFPVTDLAAARTMVAHFGRVLSAPPSVDGRRSRRWLFGAYVMAGLFLVVGLAGLWFTLQGNAQGIRRSESEMALLISMMVLGVMGTPAALVMALLARSLQRSR